MSKINYYQIFKNLNISILYHYKTNDYTYIIIDPNDKSIKIPTNITNEKDIIDYIQLQLNF